MPWRFQAALLLLALTPAFCQPEKLAVGKFLVAGRDLADPNFAEAVVLLLHYDEDGAMGLIINRRTDVTLARLFQDFKEAKGRKDEVYIGGPVELQTVLALLKSAIKPDGAERVFSDVHLVSSKALLQKTLAEGAEASAFHVFVGYSGWGAGQLEHEIKLNAWHILPADAASVFQSDPDSLWPRLIRRTEMQIAAAPTTPNDSRRSFRH
jgi:putative transcriptional regulator